MAAARERASERTHIRAHSLHHRVYRIPEYLMPAIFVLPLDRVCSIRREGIFQRVTRVVNYIPSHESMKIIFLRDTIQTDKHEHVSRRNKCDAVYVVSCFFFSFSFSFSFSTRARRSFSPFSLLVVKNRGTMHAWYYSLGGSIAVNANCRWLS